MRRSIEIYIGKQLSKTTKQRKYTTETDKAAAFTMIARNIELLVLVMLAG